jgi:hypothetical protein
MQTERDEEQGSRPGLVERAFAPHRLPAELRTPPAIVVGLPRSGTKFLTHVMNNIRGLYVFDDLYYFREARGAGAGNTLTRAQLEHVVGWLAARSMPERREQHFVRHVLDPADVERLRQALLDAFGGDAVTGIPRPSSTTVTEPSM